VAGSHDKEGEKYYAENDGVSVAADPVVQYMRKDELQKAIDRTRKSMEKAVKELDFVEAARLRDEMFEYQRLMKEK
jgi:excinuclease ABC subunit B